MNKSFKKYSSEQLIEAVPKCTSIAQVLKMLNVSIHGSNYRTLHRYIKELNLDTSHFKGKGWLKNRTHNFSPKRPMENVLVYGHKESGHCFKKRLYKEGYKDKKCEQCGITEWQEKEIVFHLHHIDGDQLNNCIDNLQILCPNCHSQTDNYTGKNIERVKYN